MKANFEKSFDNSYSYFREIQILTYLNQRSAPVPLLLEGLPKEKIITMEFVGENLYNLRNNLSFQDKLNIFDKIYQSIILYFWYKAKSLVCKPSKDIILTTSIPTFF